MHKRLPRLGLTMAVIAASVVGALATGVATAAADDGGATATAAAANASCVLPPTSTPLLGFGDPNQYFVAPGGDFEGSMSGWSLTGSASVVSGNESWYVGSPTDSNSLGLPTSSDAATTPTFCVTPTASNFRMFVKNTGSNSGTNSQLAVYLNFTSQNGHLQQVKLATLNVRSTAWTLTAPISYSQYLANHGSTNISFTFVPNDDRGNWQLDDIEIDPYEGR